MHQNEKCKARLILSPVTRSHRLLVHLPWDRRPARLGPGTRLVALTSAAHAGRVAATQPLQAFEFDAKAIRAECAQNPAFGHEVTGRFLRVTLHRLQTTRTRLLDIRTQPELLA